MKKLLLLILLLFSLMAIQAQTRDTDASQVPKAVSDKFMQEQPGITPAWKVDGKTYKAFYTDPKTNMGRLIVYDEEGNVIRRESELDKLASPPGISEYYSRKFPNDPYKTWSVEEKDGVKTYYSERNSQVILFDEKGNAVTPKTQKKK